MSKQQPQRRQRGRPARSAAEQATAKERRIPKSEKGRLKFRPGDSHALDVQMREARNYRHLITEKSHLIIEKLHRLHAELDSAQDDSNDAISPEEGALQSFLWTTYRNHKHRDHILATFLAIRRARLLAKLEAADAAISMAADLLAPDDHLLADLRAAVAHQRQEAARQRPQPTRPSAQGDDGQPDQTGQIQAAALFRVTGPDEETVQAQLATIRSERQDPTERIDHRHIYGDSQAARRQLDAFHAQVQTIRTAMSPAVGWFETFYIEKVRLNREALKYLKKGQELPPGIEIFEGIIYGPYLKYRWQEVTGGPQYTIQMSITEDTSQDESRESWPNL